MLSRLPEGKRKSCSGEVRWRNYADNLENGILIDAKTRAQLLELSEPYGIPAPWD